MNRHAGGLILWLCVAGASAASAQQAPIQLKRSGGEVGAGIEGGSINDERGYRGEQPRARAWLRLPFEGVVGSPRLFTWSGSVRPSYLRGPSGDGGIVRVSETGYEASGRLFPGGIASLTGVFARTRGLSRRDGFVLSDLGSDIRSLQGHVRLRGITLRGEAGDRRQDQAWSVSSDAPLIEQTVRIRTLRVDAVNSKMQLWRQRDLRNGPATTDEYLTYTTGGTHSLRWGHGSELASQFTQDEQRRPNDTGQWWWTERARLRHTLRLESTWTREERHSWDRGQDAHAVGWGGRVLHSPRAALRWGGHYEERRAASAGEWSVTRNGGPEVAWGTRLAGAVRADIAAGYDIEMRRIDGEDHGPVSVLDERAVVDASGSILLLRSGVDAASLRIESPDHTLLYLDGVDYRTIPGVATFQVLVLPGGRLRAGDAVLLSYTYQPPANGESDARALRWNLVTTWNSFTARWGMRRRTADGSGIAVTARSSAYDENELLLDFDRTTRRGRLHAMGGVTRRVLEGSRQQVADVRGEWSAPPSRWGQPSLMAGWSRRTGEAAEVVIDDASAGWIVVPAPVLTSMARLEYRRSRFDGQAAERSAGATIDLDLRVASLESQFRYGFTAIRDGINRDAHHVMLRVTRRF